MHGLISLDRLTPSSPGFPKQEPCCQRKEPTNPTLIKSLAIRTWVQEDMLDLTDNTN